jgi:aminoglycoside phosphotransferase (APT) family kinase protein
MADPLCETIPVRTGEELDLARLEPFLRSHFPECEGPLAVDQFPGGHSNLTYLIRLAERRMVLRRPPFGSKVKTAHDVGREYRVLSKLHDAYPVAPRVLLHCDDASVIGAPFYLMEPVQGIVVRKDPPPNVRFDHETSKHLGEAFIDNLANLHGLDYTAIGLGDLGKPQGYLQRQVRGWIDRYHGSQTEERPEVERISTWLLEQMPSESEAALIHNDYKYDNLVLDPADVTRITGVLDWEMSTIGDPLSDLGVALAYWVETSDPEELQQIRWGPTNYPGSLSRRQLIEHYAEKSGRRVRDALFYLVFARFKIAVIIQQIYYRYHHGLTRDGRFATMPERISILLRAAEHSANTGSI